MANPKTLGREEPMLTQREKTRRNIRKDGVSLLYGIVGGEGGVQPRGKRLLSWTSERDLVDRGHLEKNSRGAD